MKKLAYILFFLSCFSYAQTVVLSGTKKAIPEALGYGAVQTFDWTNPTLHFVTSLSNSGAGTLREAVDACTNSNNDVIIFRTSGLISISSSINIDSDKVYIAGETSPNGIVIRSSLTSFNFAGINLTGDNVTINNIAVYLGKSSAGNTNLCDDITIQNNNYWLIYQCEFGWGSDENVNAWTGGSNGTLQLSLVFEPFHNGGSPGRAILYGGTNISTSSRFITTIETAVVNAGQRAMLINSTADSSVLFEVINNIAYNLTHYGMQLQNNDGYGTSYAQMNFLGNDYRLGPNSNDRGFIGIGGNNKLYAEGNIGENRTTDSGDEYQDIYDSPLSRTALSASKKLGSKLATPLENHNYRPADTLRTYLADWAGMALKRNSVSTRVLGYLGSGGGLSVDSDEDQDDFGGYPTISVGTIPTDADDDGIADTWESSYSLTSNTATITDWTFGTYSVTNSSSYTNLEMYLYDLREGYKIMATGEAPVVDISLTQKLKQMVNSILIMM